MATGTGLSMQEEKERAPCTRAMYTEARVRKVTDFVMQSQMQQSGDEFAVVEYSILLPAQCAAGRSSFFTLPHTPWAAQSPLFKLSLTWCSPGFAAEINSCVAPDEPATTSFSILKVTRVLKASYNSERSAW